MNGTRDTVDRHCVIGAAATVILGSALMHTAIAAEACDGWPDRGDGIGCIRIDHERAQGGTVSLTVVRADLTRNRAVIIFTSEFLRRSRASPIPVPIVKQSRDPAARSFPQRSLKEIALVLRPRAAINGGYTGSFSYSIPAGLLKVAGNTVAQLNRDDETQSGVLCVKQGKATLVRKGDYVSDACDDAVQAGPFIIDPGGKPGITKARKHAAYERSVACVGVDDALYLVRTSRVTLFDLAAGLVKEGERNGFRCAAALNLSGDFESGLYVGSLAQEAELDTSPDLLLGNFLAPITSAIAIVTRVPTMPVTSESAEDDERAEGDLWKIVTKMLIVLDKDTASVPEKIAELIEVVGEGIALEQISRFVVGRRWDAATEDARQQFRSTFLDFLVRSYLLRFSRAGEFDIEDARVIGLKGSTDRLVRFEITDQRKARTVIDWRLMEIGDKYVIRDVKVDSASQAMALRSEFGEVLRSSGLPGLTRYLRASIGALDDRIAKLPPRRTKKKDSTKRKPE